MMQFQFPQSFKSILQAGVFRRKELCGVLKKPVNGCIFNWLLKIHYFSSPSTREKKGEGD